MRILHVHSGNLYGGVETILMTLARHQQVYPKLQHEFALCFEGRLRRELEAVPASIHSIGPVRVSRPYSVIRGRRQLRKLLTARTFDALVFHSAWSQAVFAPVARATQIPVVVWMHGTMGGKHWSERWARTLKPDLLICNSRFTASEAGAIYPKVSPHVIYCPLELSRRQLSRSERASIRAELNTATDAVVIVQVSRIEPGKGHSLHLDALHLLKSVPNWICWFAGGPQRPVEKRYFDQMQAMSARLGIFDRVRFLNERADVKNLLRAADIFCQPNLTPEPFGITFVEALNAGLPVVTSNIGAAKEIVDDACGILVDKDAAQIASALGCLIEDARLRRRLGQAGPARADSLCNLSMRIQEFSTAVGKAVSSRPVHQP